MSQNRKQTGDIVGTNVKEEIWASRDVERGLLGQWVAKLTSLFSLFSRTKNFQNQSGLPSLTTPQNCSLALTCNEKTT